MPSFVEAAIPHRMEVIPLDPDARSTSLIACPECFHPHPSTVVRPDMSSNQVMAQGFMDSGYGGCLLHAQGILPVAFAGR